MKRVVLCLSMACLGLLLVACSSAPTHFYTLLPPASTAAPAQTASYRIAVLPVGIPAQVDRPQMVVREGGGSVALLEGEHWIAPLGDEIRTALSSELTRQLGAEDVYGLPHPEDVPVYRVKVDINRFDSVPGQYTLLSAVWSVHAASGKGPLLQCASRVREPVGPGYAALAEGHQRGLRALAGEIAAAVRRMTGGSGASCPAGH